MNQQQGETVESTSVRELERPSERGTWLQSQEEQESINQSIKNNANASQFCAERKSER